MRITAETQRAQSRIWRKEGEDIRIHFSPRSLCDLRDSAVKN